MDLCLSLTLLGAALAGGCATRYVEPGIDAPHAVLAFPPQREQIDSGLFIEPLEFNGVLRPRRWLHEQFRVPPGELRLLAGAARGNLQGSCLLSFPVAAGEIYRVAAEAGEDVFILSASQDGRLLAQCEGAKTVLPTPMRIPGVIPAPWGTVPRE